MIISGKKSILFPITPKDSDYLDKLATSSGSWLIGNRMLAVENESRGWLARTKEGKASRNIGVIIVTLMPMFSAIMKYFVDNTFFNGIDKELKNNRYTYAEDAIRIALDEIFKNGIIRVEILVMRKDELTLSFLKKVGFKISGQFGTKQDDKLQDYFLLTLWKEAKNG